MWPADLTECGKVVRSRLLRFERGWLRQLLLRLLLLSLCWLLQAGRASTAVRLSSRPCGQGGGVHAGSGARCARS